MENTSNSLSTRKRLVRVTVSATLETKIFTGIFVIGLILFAGGRIWGSENIAITTDKKEYYQGEPVKITIQNKQKEPLLIYGLGTCANRGIPTQVEKYENGRWVKIFANDCPMFNQRIAFESRNENYTSFSLSPNSFIELKTIAYEKEGLLRLIYYLKKGKLKVYSNEFRIRMCKAHGEKPDYIRPGADMSIQCCKGLLHRIQKGQFDNDCTNLFEKYGGGGYVGICLACGDGICDMKFENKCNCPEDCK